MVFAYTSIFMCGSVFMHILLNFIIGNFTVYTSIINLKVLVFGCLLIY